MAECALMKIADTLETQAREFLAANPEGGRINIPFTGDAYLAVAVTVGTFEDEGWEIEFGYDDDDQEWLMFRRPKVELLGYQADSGGTEEFVR